MLVKFERGKIEVSNNQSIRRMEVEKGKDDGKERRTIILVWRCKNFSFFFFFLLFFRVFVRKIRKILGGDC